LRWGKLVHVDFELEGPAPRRDVGVVHGHSNLEKSVQGRVRELVDDVLRGLERIPPDEILTTACDGSKERPEARLWPSILRPADRLFRADLTTLSTLSGFTFIDLWQFFTAISITM
jgi:hypothetical protein